ncbi:MAG: lysophospholipid acyltransferase family protein [Abditibacteriaceae bacterium]
MKKENEGNWSLAFRAVYTPAWLAVGVTLKVLSPRFAVTGRGNLPRRGAMIFAPNHLSDIDPVLVGFSALRPLSYMAKKSLFDIAVLGPMMRFANAFPVEQNSPDRAALREAEAQLKKGHSLVVFPEGKCSLDGNLQPLLPGVALLAMKCNVPVIPVGIVNSNQLMPYGKVLPRFTMSKVRINFAPPLMTDDLKELSSREARAVFNDRLETALSNAM